MRGAVALAVAFIALAGCARNEPANPNLLAPKLILDVDVENGTVLYVHSAFGDRAYDKLELALDNASRATREYAYSLEERFNLTDGFIEVKARSGESRFAWRGAIAVDFVDDRIRIATVDDQGEWSERRAYGLPFEAILPRLGEERA